MSNDKIFDAAPSQIALAKVFSSVTLLGPPMGDKLVRLISHLFSPEEAEIAQHLPSYYPRTQQSLKKLAAKVGRAPEEVLALLEAMSKRRTIFKTKKGYALLPLIPGMFERMLIGGANSDWHKEYARMLNELYATGYVRKYNNRKVPGIRNIPVQRTVESKTLVTSADLVSEMIDFHKELLVANVCQCRQAARFIGKECKRSKPEDGCLVFGSFATMIAANQDGRLVSKEEMRDIVTDRWEKKLVFFTANVSPQSPNAICTCCDCCCHYLESVNNFEGVANLAHPHFLVEVDESLCNDCGKCAKACNTRAHIFQDKKHSFAKEKCIGCGVCMTVCKQDALELVANAAFKPPSKDFKQLAIRLLPGTVIAGVKSRLTR
jgi:Na+-translocating ferredoxin:NAD+ oxidoreductase subunit B